MNEHMTLNRRNFLRTTAAAGAALAGGLTPSLAFGAVNLKGGSLETAIDMLNMWEKQPDNVLALYSAVYKALAKSPTTDFKAVSEDATVTKLCAEQGVLHLGGPLLGCLKDDGVSVWLRTTKPASVTVIAQIDGQNKTFGPVKSTFESDLTARVEITGLPADSTTPYKVLVDGKEISTTAKTVITTPPKEASKATRIAFATCPHRWGLSNGKQADTVLSRNPHAMLLYGDVAVQDRHDNLGMHRADYALRDFHPAWQKLAAAVPIYSSWDDHDYTANDGWGVGKTCSEKGRVGLRKVFTQSWNNPYYGLGDEGGGIFQHTRIGPCDIVMTDNRYFRTKEGKDCFFGKEQMDWLKKTLLSCKGPFIILTCGTMWSDYVSGGKDSWGKFDPEAREEILSLIEKEKIPGVLLLSGDRHGARGFKIPRPSGYEFYEFEPASFGGRGGPAATSDKWKTQLFGISNRYAFGEFTFDTSKADPEVTFKLIDSHKGSTIYELTLKRSQLTPG